MRRACGLCRQRGAGAGGGGGGGAWMHYEPASGRSTSPSSRVMRGHCTAPCLEGGSARVQCLGCLLVKQTVHGSGVRGACVEAPSARLSSSAADRPPNLVALQHPGGAGAVVPVERRGAVLAAPALDGRLAACGGRGQSSQGGAGWCGALHTCPAGVPTARPRLALHAAAWLTRVPAGFEVAIQVVHATLHGGWSRAAWWRQGRAARPCSRRPIASCSEPGLSCTPGRPSSSVFLGFRVFLKTVLLTTDLLKALAAGGGAEWRKPDGQRHGAGGGVGGKTATSATAAAGSCLCGCRAGLTCCSEAGAGQQLEQQQQGCCSQELAGRHGWGSEAGGGVTLPCAAAGQLCWR